MQQYYIGIMYVHFWLRFTHLPNRLMNNFTNYINFLMWTHNSTYRRDIIFLYHISVVFFLLFFFFIFFFYFKYTFQTCIWIEIIMIIVIIWRLIHNQKSSVKSQKNSESIWKEGVPPPESMRSRPTPRNGGRAIVEAYISF